MCKEKTKLLRKMNREPIWKNTKMLSLTTFCQYLWYLRVVLESGENCINSIGSFRRKGSPIVIRLYYETAVKDAIFTPFLGAFYKSLEGIYRCDAQCNAKV